MKILAIYNPISGDTDKSFFLENLRGQSSHYGFELDIYETTGKDDLAMLKAIIKKSEPERLLAMGGDGTFALAARAAMNSACSVGVIPFGSSNGLAKEIGVQSDPLEALDDFLKSHLIVDMDMIRINDTDYCIHLGDIGLNARIVKSFHEDENRGMVTYAKYLAQEIKNEVQIGYRINCENGIESGEAAMIAFGNGRKFGTGVPINMNGNPFDGKFELIVVEKIGLATILNAGISIVNDASIEKSIDKKWSLKEATIHFSEPQMVQADGELLGQFKVVKLEIIEKAFRVVTNAKNPYLSAKGSVA